jgi:hypothetical protein
MLSSTNSSRTRLIGFICFSCCFLFQAIVLHALSNSSPVTPEPSAASIKSRRQQRRITLLPWKLSSTTGEDTAHPLGWAVESRDETTQAHQVSVGWGDVGWGDRNSGIFNTKDEEAEALLRVASAVSIPLPYFAEAEVETLGSSLWPGSILGAILSQSPTLEAINRSPKDDAGVDGTVCILELGAGLGLHGLATAQASSECKVKLTDNDPVAVEKLHQLLRGVDRVDATLLDWRDEVKVGNFDVVLGSDVAYYHHLLRPLMDTVEANLKTTDSLLLLCGQANRDSQWDLYRNIRDGCYNQVTDVHDKPWPGDCKMLLYRLEMGHWGEEGQRQTETDGTIPMAVLCYQSPGMKFPPISDCDYAATEEDFESLSMSF